VPIPARRLADGWADRDDILAIAQEQLPAYLLRQRWYPAKDAGMPTVRLTALSRFAVPDLPAAIVIWEARPPGRPPLELLLPLALVPLASLPPDHPSVIAAVPRGSAEAADTVIVDAFEVDAFVRAFVRLLWQSEAEAEAAQTAARIRGAHTAEAPSMADGAFAMDDAVIRRGTAEQSNTSIRIGDHAIMKVIRKLERGIHPELEVGRFLTEQAHFRATPALLGWIEFDGFTLAILQSFVANEGDGWSWVLERLRADSDAECRRALKWIRRLGEVTAELHLALAISTGDPAFEPENVSEADWPLWSGAALATARRVTDSLQTARPAAVCELTAGRLPGLLHLRPVKSALAKTRHHGDYHLGQVLVRGDDAVIVDFEGEPLRPLAERRAKQLPLRDVAGMLRSFAYAIAVVEREQGGAKPRLRRWRKEASQIFVDSYLATAGAGPGCPADRADAMQLIRFFTLEKALYETAYELANRPAWVDIPLGAVLEFLQSQTPLQRIHRMPQGAELQSSGGVRFRLWAPRFAVIHLALEGEDEALPMTALDAGWHELVVLRAGVGSRYRFVLPDGVRVPDPASRFQPDDVHGPSEVIDPTAYAWGDGDWAGRPWHEAVIYELHVGAFTEAGTFRAAIDRLDHLVGLGVTAVELMPVGDFPGKRNWGYDGVLPYAPDSTYGRPDDLKALVDAAHARGLMVLLDVVYNHFGPDGNYLPAYAPTFFTERHHTPWGAAVNFDGSDSAAVREFFIHNALYWIEEYNLDGLRLDAVHAIIDDSAKDVLDELAERVRAQRPNAHLILENEENQAGRLRRDADARPRHYSAQWNDDVHHVLHTAATGEDAGYYQEFLGDTSLLARALAEGFAFQGQMMEFRGEPRGEPSALLPPTAFVAFVQNHDQIGNRAFGERLTAIAPLPAVRAIAAVYLLLPQVPMLFMGEEWGAAQPFAFFCDFHGDLAAAVRTGRRKEFAKFPQFRDPAMRERIPDPQAESTFAATKLDWDAVGRAPHAEWLAFYRSLLAVRHAEVMPLLPQFPGYAGEAMIVAPLAVVVRWSSPGGAQLCLAANLSAQTASGFPAPVGRVLWQEGQVDADGTASPWAVRWSVLAPRAAD
jgi:malto-oligosyltrehalose trehalohydrolase